MNKPSISKCREILNKDGKKYNDDEIEKPSNLLYVLVEIEHENFINQLEDERKSSDRNF